jgi:hypothetical protein
LSNLLVKVNQVRLIHRSAWKGDSRKVPFRILHMRRYRDTFLVERSRDAPKATTTTGGCGYKSTVANVAFVAANKGTLAAMVYLLV